MSIIGEGIEGLVTKTLQTQIGIRACVFCCFMLQSQLNGIGIIINKLFVKGEHRFDTSIWRKL